MQRELADNPRSLALRRLWVWAAPIATLIGVFANDTWRSVSFHRPAELVALAAIAAGFALVLHRAGRVHPFAALVAAWGAGLVLFGGVAQVAFAMLTVCAALGVGTLFRGTRGIGQRWLALPAGLALICGATGWLLAWPIHHAVVYSGVFALVVALRWRTIAGALASMGRGGARAFDAAPWSAVFALLIVGIASTGAWMPTVQADDIAYHLGLPYELQTLGYARLDPASTAWALAPWASDVLHAIVQVQAGEEARGAVGAIWLVLCAIGTWHVARSLGVPVALRWIGIAAFSSLPLVYAQVAGMQTELPSCAVALALVVALLRRSRVASRIALVAALAGLLLALKVSNGLLLLPMAAWLFARLRGDVASLAFLRAVVVGVSVGGASYATAWYVAGNPVLPMLNGVFGSPYFPPHNWIDGRWTATAWNLPWSWMFDTDRYVEAVDGAGGMLMLVALVGGALAMRMPRARIVALVGFVACALSFTTIQYLRYVLPAFAVLWPAALAGLAQRRMHRETCVAVGALVLANAWLMAAGTWSIANGLLRETVLHGHDAAIAQFAPHRALAEFLRVRFPEKQVLLVDGHHLAERAGRAYTVAWFDHALAHEARMADEDPGGTRWRALLARLDIDLVASAAPLPAALRTALSTLSATRVPEMSAVDLWAIPRASLPARIEAGPGKEQWSIRIGAAGVAGHVEARVRFDCAPAGHPIATMWGHPDATGGIDGSWWGWASCLSDGTAEIARTMPGGTRDIAILAEPVQPMTLSVRGVEAHLRIERERRDRAAALRRRIADTLGLASNGAAE